MIFENLHKPVIKNNFLNLTKTKKFLQKTSYLLSTLNVEKDEKFPPQDQGWGNVVLYYYFDLTLNCIFFIQQSVIRQEEKYIGIEKE